MWYELCVLLGRTNTGVPLLLPFSLLPFYPSTLLPSTTCRYNATVFAYGPTGAGKTYTMLGTDKEPGVMVHTLKDLFSKSDAHCADASRGVKHKVSLSYLEVYVEENVIILFSVARNMYTET